MDGTVLVIGEALVDRVIDARGIRHDRPGGSPANVAVGVSRLGIETELVTSLGDDDAGRIVMDHLWDSRVKVLSRGRAEDITSSSEAWLDADGVAQYRFDIRFEIAPVTVPPSTQLLHVGSVSSVMDPGAEQVVMAVNQARPRAMITYDPNIRGNLIDDPFAVRSRIDALVTRADVVKASEEDLAWWAPGENYRDIAEKWLASGPSLVVVTRGGEGAYVTTRQGSFEVEAPHVDVADTIGAGDSFMAGLIVGLADADLVGPHRREALFALDEPTAKPIVEFATRCAAITVQRRGADLPRRADL